jgi:hypothetical protein
MPVIEGNIALQAAIKIRTLKLFRCPILKETQNIQKIFRLHQLCLVTNRLIKQQEMNIYVQRLEPHGSEENT